MKHRIRYRDPILNIEEKLLAEIDQVTGGDPEYDLQYDDLAALSARRR